MEERVVTLRRRNGGAGYLNRVGLLFESDTLVVPYVVAQSAVAAYPGELVIEEEDVPEALPAVSMEDTHDAK